MKTETREVASLESDFSRAMSGFGKSKATVPPQDSSLLLAKVGFCTFPTILGLAGLPSHMQPRLQAEEEAPDTGQFVGTPGKTPISKHSLCLVPVPEGLRIKSHSLSQAPCSVQSRFPGEARSESQGENQAEPWRPLRESSQFTHMRRLRQDRRHDLQGIR